MGQEISLTPGASTDMNEFSQGLREETSLLARWFQDGRFASCSDGHTVGLELEMWLVDQKFEPLPENKKFLESMADPMVVPELSKFNAELNSLPELVGSGCLERVAQGLKESWKRIQGTMETLNGHMLAIGTLPTIRDPLLTVDHMSDFDRYRALNEYVLHLRRGKPLQLSIEGRDQVHAVHHDIMLEAAATSFQVHIQPPYELMTATFNAAVVAS
ncbi:MAG: hypothetical protein M3Q07_25210, partial [Pseudobdellovibrionaceae bacterium]|nr:hypothetical protein [Pseudobdellovibrionaceae bacterium]